MNKRRILKTWPCNNQNHRSDFVHCPHCDHFAVAGDWAEAATILIIGIVYGKHGAMVYVSECPKCFQPSWIHERIDRNGAMDRLYKWPMTWTKACNVEYERRKAIAAKNWAAGLCKNCALLEKHSDSETTDYRFCDIGSGGAKTKCDSFKPK